MSIVPFGPFFVFELRDSKKVILLSSVFLSLDVNLSEMRKSHLVFRILMDFLFICFPGESICSLDGRLPNGRQGQDDGQLRLRLGGEVHSGLPLDATSGEAARHQPAHSRHSNRRLRRNKISQETKIKSNVSFFLEDLKHLYFIA